MKKKKSYAFAATLAVAGALVASGLSAAPAVAGNPLTCADSRVCGWSNPNYEGNNFMSTLNPYNVSSNMSTAVSSFVNKRAGAVQLFTNVGCTGNTLTVPKNDVRSNLARNGFDNKTKCVKNF